MAIYSVRLALFLGYTLLLMLPNLIDQVLPSRARGFSGTRSLRVLASLLVVPGLLFSLLSVHVFDNVVEAQWPASTAAAVAALAGPSGKVFATLSHADRLLWRRPELRGRVAFDARIELLDSAQLEAIAAVLQNPNHPLLREFGVFVVDRSAKGALEPHGFELIAEDDQAAVYRRRESP